MAKEYYDRLNHRWGEKTVTGRVIGRDHKIIPPDEVTRLAELGCNDSEIAAWFGVNVNTLRYNFMAELVRGHESVKHRLRGAMLENAVSRHNAAVQIFLAKNMLGMSDVPMKSQDQEPLPWGDDSPDGSNTQSLTPEQRAALEQRLDEYRSQQANNSDPEQSVQPQPLNPAEDPAQ